MRVTSNYTLLNYVLGGLSQSPFSGQWLSTPTRISWNSCLDLDLGVDQDDLLFPVQCARLTVPLDYTDHMNDVTTEIQLLRVPATVTPSKGSVIINPGGPGESGCDYLALRASRFHAYVDHSVETLTDDSSILGGQFDLVSFDPR
jgi:hypothetical protein